MSTLNLGVNSWHHHQLNSRDRGVLIMFFGSVNSGSHTSGIAQNRSAQQASGCGLQEAGCLRGTGFSVLTHPGLRIVAYSACIALSDGRRVLTACSASGTDVSGDPSAAGARVSSLRRRLLSKGRATLL